MFIKSRSLQNNCKLLSLGVELNIIYVSSPHPRRDCGKPGQWRLRLCTAAGCGHCCVRARSRAATRPVRRQGPGWTLWPGTTPVWNNNLSVSLSLVKHLCYIFSDCVVTWHRDWPGHQWTQSWYRVTSSTETQSLLSRHESEWVSSSSSVSATLR